MINPETCIELDEALKKPRIIWLFDHVFIVQLKVKLTDPPSTSPTTFEEEEKLQSSDT